jgi:4a-hydroxytetrahydrobiopterin dehydratase
MLSTIQKPEPLSTSHCKPCTKDEKALTRGEAEVWLEALHGWVMDEKAEWLKKSYKFPNFVMALEFANLIGDVAEKEKHHPDVAFGWGYVHVKLQTHAICGLHRNDFILASKIDKLHQPA